METSFDQQSFFSPAVSLSTHTEWDGLLQALDVSLLQQLISKALQSITSIPVLLVY